MGKSLLGESIAYESCSIYTSMSCDPNMTLFGYDITQIWRLDIESFAGLNNCSLGETSG